MTHIPLLYGKAMTSFFTKMMRAKRPMDKLKVLSSFRLSHLKPIIGIQVGLTDPYCGLNMGQTAEILSREFGISREEQDRYALQSHQRALQAQEDQFFDGEILPISAPPKFLPILKDDGPMAEQSLDKLKKLKPYFDRLAGTVTVGNACPVTDGAAMVLLCTEETAKERGLNVMGYLRDWEYAGLDGSRMGLGPAYATAKLFDRSSYSMSDFSKVELNEAFAAQVLANMRAFESDSFAQKYLNRSSALGDLPEEITNVNGGAIALGNPVGTTGTRLIITMLRELKRSSQSLGLATLCIGGGQGASLVLEVES
jgi:acetyl-CoA C-acetyltransferase/acetyl-CoA acyltransferase